MINYNNGPGNVPRLPDRVVDTLIDSAGVSRCAPGRGISVTDQTAQVERLVHDACEELLARLPSQAASLPAAPAPTELAEPDLIADIKRLVKLSDDVGRSRGSNNYARNEGAVTAIVELEQSVLARVAARQAPTSVPKLDYDLLKLALEQAQERLRQAEEAIAKRDATALRVAQCAGEFARDVARQAPDGRDAGIERAAAICEAFCASDDNEEGINFILRQRAQRIRALKSTAAIAKEQAS